MELSHIAYDINKIMLNVKIIMTSYLYNGAKKTFLKKNFRSRIILIKPRLVFMQGNKK